ncbi:MAG: VOC family protein [Gammaproteobacteria bacterium]|nr:VOC family protein [Gammaproteobacteria bacterium]MDH3412428.1 VOC family protein [Gammaproteobacteria bacterium]
MEQRLSMITLGVADLTRAVAFYENVIGWTPAPSLPNIVFFNLSGLLLALVPHVDLAKGMNAVAHESHDFAYKGFFLSHNVRSKKEVDTIFSRLKDSGATIINEPEEAVWGGYYFYFSDVDGHSWRVFYNPQWTVQEDGRVSMKKN